MHELPIVNKILETVLCYAEEEKAKKVLSVHLVIGEMHDLLDEWVIKYFSFASRGTIADSAKIEIERTPIICQCGKCRELFISHLRENKQIQCPVCGSLEYVLQSGDELMLDRIEIR